MQDTQFASNEFTLPNNQASQSLITLYHSPPKDLARAFAHCQTTVWGTSSDRAGPALEAIAPTTIVDSKNGWLIDAHGKPPQLRLPALAALSGRSLILRVEITAPHETELRVYYGRTSQADGTLTRHVGSLLSAGHNVVYLSIDVPDRVGRLRFEPGRCAGQFCLHGFELRAADPEPKCDIEDMPSTD
jgi:hypothetical protein